MTLRSYPNRPTLATAAPAIAAGACELAGRLGARGPVDRPARV
ncbi:MAG: hypothetical protein R3195_04160 [Gemmatimonadota bacterium]|nr:hypothetical protein [Gemmatimonadota bacterium]